MNTEMAMRMDREFSVRGVTFIDMPSRDDKTFQRLVSLRREVYGDFFPDESGRIRKGPVYRRIFFWPLCQLVMLRDSLRDDACSTAYAFLEYRKADIRVIDRTELGSDLVRISFRKARA